MGVYINMEMPKSCPCELVGVGYDLYCSFAHGIPARVREYDECREKETRPDWCPFIEVQEPHGRLIDTGSGTFPTLHRNPSNDYMHGWNACLKSVHQQPTIIPASEEASA